MTKPPLPPPEGVPRPSWRKPAGVFVMIGMIAAIGALVWVFGPNIAMLPFVVQMALYATLGIVWILPLRPLLIWMETGKWRA